MIKIIGGIIIIVFSICFGLIAISLTSILLVLILKYIFEEIKNK